MKLKLLITLALGLGLTGCSTMDIQELKELASKVGNVEYHRNGVWTDSDLIITVNEDGTRTVHYNARVKAPGGPGVDITIEDIDVEEEDE